MTRQTVIAVAATTLVVATLLLWGRYGAAVVLADPGWLCLTG